MYVVNPNAVAVEQGRGEVGAAVSGEEKVVAEAVGRLVAGWPAADELGEAIRLIGLHELTAAVRRSGIEASAEAVEGAVRELGLEVE